MAVTDPTTIDAIDAITAEFQETVARATHRALRQMHGQLPTPLARAESLELRRRALLRRNER